MEVAVLEYNAGNVRSVLYALERLGVRAEVTGSPERLASAAKVIFPGVGEASSTMRYLREHGLDGVIRSLEKPVLGICLGLQLLCSHSMENDTECLGVFPEPVLRFDADRAAGIKVPHMGWNAVSATRGPLFEGIPEGTNFYFVHSFYAQIGDDTCGVCNHGIDFSAAVSSRNFSAVQFHPEKSGPAGERLLSNFLKL
ncbi:MAG: imidazole glycerol phosphate synthase subunit HisH [Deltaproteobacteria bacterium]|nr:imidazole glycerol phosphate synthase subunit HisH [Deltaproteobacteria bacterium]